MQELVDKLLTKSPLAMKLVKGLVNYGMDVDLNTGLELERSALASFRDSPSHREGLDAFKDRKKA